MSDHVPGDRWISGPGVPQGELGAQPRFRVVMARMSGDAEPRHVEFSDPPGDLSPERYEEMLREMAETADSLEDLGQAFVQALAGDMIFSHGVDPARASQAAMQFAARLYAEAHPDQ